MQCEATSGTILVDGIDISTLGLSDLRSRMAIIPQEPVMFRGTVRSNLDPFNQYTDREVWQALEVARLRDWVEVRVSALPGNGSC